MTTKDARALGRRRSDSDDDASRPKKAKRKWFRNIHGQKIYVDELLEAMGGLIEPPEKK
jgi:hypothetical protein